MAESEIKPPRIADRILRWFCSGHVLEFLQGDLYELYAYRLVKYGKVRAGFHYFFDVLSACRPFAFKKSRSRYLNHTAMFQHNFILTIRNFKKHKSQFFINLAGLAAGLVCVLFIYLWVNDERQMDTFHEKDERLYQVMSNHTDASGITTWRGVPGLLLDEIKANVPEIEHASACTDSHEFTVSAEETYLKGKGKFASEEFLEVFTYPLLEGNPKTALSGTSGIIITESLSRKLFKEDSPMGKSIDWHIRGKSKTLMVTGVMQDLPKNASDRFDFLISWDYYHNELIEYKNWYNYYARVMVVLKPLSKTEEVTRKVDAILKEKQGDDRVDLFLTKYSGLYLNDTYENGEQAGGRVEYVNLFTIIALFILFIASINFINLSTAKASHRIKEIGVKKSLGASRLSLMGQYFTESVLISLISLVVAILVVGILLPQFNQIAQKSIVFEFDLQLFGTFIGLIVLVGLVAGSYPALYLSGLKAMEILKGRLARKSPKTWGRKSLVVVQFTLSIILMVSVIVVYKQMEYVKNKNLGFDRENLIYFEREGKLAQQAEAFTSTIRNIPGVTNSTVSGFKIGGENSTGGVSWEGKRPEDQIQFWEIRSGVGLTEILELELVDGRSFSTDFDDSNSVIFNETAIAAMGLENPIGKTISHYKGDKKIVGVVKDFNLISLHSKVEPMILLYLPEEAFYIMVKIARGNEVETIGKIGEVYESFNPGYVFKPKFVDQDYQALYAAEQRVSILSRYFAGFAIFISCLGLFGLAAFTAESRIKEIGIRKILGSSVFGIIFMLSIDFTRMVLAAICIALPISYFATSKWLEDFAYTIDLKWWFFAGSALISLVIAWVTVGLQTYKAATINPKDCLRDE